MEFDNWDDLDCKMDLLRGIYSYGFENPSPIQKKAILPMLTDRDLIAQAQSGTGKTGCFTVGILQKIDITIQTTQAIIMAPTRELAEQIINVLNAIGSHMKGLKTHLLVGGTRSEYDVKTIQNNIPHVIVCTPGRLYDMFTRNAIDRENLNFLVIDEADEMMSQGFQEQLYEIFKYFPNDIQICLFTATIPDEIENITNKFMRDPEKILVKKDSLTLEGIKQNYIQIENDHNKFEVICDLYSSISVTQTIIYCNSIPRVERLYEDMIKENYPVSFIHSGLDKELRNKNFNEFKNGKTRILISTDITSRGIDIQQVSTVINFDLPKSVHVYLHRIGRSGRWGRKGRGINLVTKYDLRQVKTIESHYSTEITELQNDW